MVNPIKIKDKTIGEGYPTFLIAEMACAHQGNINDASDLVDIAVKAKADAIQLQVFKKEIYMSPIYKDYGLITQLELSQEEWIRVIDLIKKENILFFAAGYDVESVRLLINKEVDAFKLHSSDLSNPEVLKEVAKSKKPIFLSTGASSFEEIKDALNFLKKNGSDNIILMHGYQGYPTQLEDTNLNYIKTLKRVFGLNVGFYDHVDGGSILAKIIPIMAIGYGAQVIEKHFILTREDKGVDYQSSLDAQNFIEFIEIFRECEKSIGNKHIRDFTAAELNYRAHCKKSIVAGYDIPKGSKITRDKIMFLRNDPGIAPIEFSKIEGKIVKRNIKKYDNITENDF